MNFKKEIIVVAPDQYKDIGRKLSHDISKVNGCNGALWSIKQFEDNEFQLGGNRHVIFIGNKNENHLVKDFIEVISNINNKAGACFGFDGAKAVVFGEGKLEQEEEFKKISQETACVLAASVATGYAVSVGVAAAGSAATAGAATAGTALIAAEGAATVAAAPLLIPVGVTIAASAVVLLPAWYLTKSISRKKKEHLLRAEQAKVALALFMTEHFDNWVGLEK
jgi:hypothetical protein